MEEDRTLQPVNNRTMLNGNDTLLLSYGYRVMMDRHEFVSYPTNSSIRVWSGATQNDHYDTHYHSAVEVIMCVRGQVRICVPQREFVIGPGEVFLIPSAMPHSLTMGENSERNLFLFEMDYLLSCNEFLLLTPIRSVPLLIARDSGIRQSVWERLEKIISEYHSDNPLKNMVIYSLLLETYAQLGQEFLVSASINAGLSGDRIHAYLDLLRRVIEYVDQHYMEDLPLDRIATEAGFSKYYFLRLFKRLTGETFHQYLCQKRVLMAESYMRLTDLPVLQIAMRTGFNSIATFNRIYKDIRGMTPSQYRSLYKNGHAG